MVGWSFLKGTDLDQVLRRFMTGKTNQVTINRASALSSWEVPAFEDSCLEHSVDLLTVLLVAAGCLLCEL